MAKKVYPTPSLDSIRSSKNITPDEKLIIRRALKWLPPEFRRLHCCVESKLKRFYAEPDKVCSKQSESFLCVSCSTELSCRWSLTEPPLTEEEICKICTIAKEAIYRDIIRRTGRDPRKKVFKAEFYIVPVVLPNSGSDR